MALTALRVFRLCSIDMATIMSLGSVPWAGFLAEPYLELLPPEEGFLLAVAGFFGLLAGDGTRFYWFRGSCSGLGFGGGKFLLAGTLTFFFSSTLGLGGDKLLTSTSANETGLSFFVNMLIDLLEDGPGYQFEPVPFWLFWAYAVFSDGSAT